METVARNLKRDSSFLEKKFCRNSGERMRVSWSGLLTFYAAKFTRDLELPANLHICLLRVHRMSRRFILNFTVRQRSILDLERASSKKSRLGWKLRKTRAKEGEQGQKKWLTKTKKTLNSWQQAIKVRGKASPMLFQNHPRRKILGLVEWK